MPLTTTYNPHNPHNTVTSSPLELVRWPSGFANKKSLGQTTLSNNVFALQTTRISPNNGVNDLASPYQSFNLGLHVGDCVEKVTENRQCLQKIIPVGAQIQWLDQVHGSDVAEISRITKQPITADALITRKRKVCLAIMTADCLPILLVSKSGDEIAAIHGGWRPLSANIIYNTIRKMHTAVEDLYVWLGPCISQGAFEVGSEVKAEFVQKSEAFNAAFIETVQGKYLADLHKIAEIQLISLGLNKISKLPECTYANTDKYYSYRKESVTGRMATLICIQ